MLPRPTVALLLGAAWLALVAGCASHGRALREVVQEINATLEEGPTRLLPGDTLRVFFPEYPDWDQTVEVRTDGRATFAWIGELQVAGLSARELDAQLKEAYAGVFPLLDMAVDVAWIAPRRVFVMGEVHRPGEFEVEGRVTLLEALALAGGPLKETALLENTLFVRWSQREQRQRAWRIDAAVEHWEASVPLLIQPHDVIFIPNTPIDDVDIWVDQYIRRLIPFPYIVPPLY